MSSFLDYTAMSGEGGSCSVRGFHSDHGITTFQSCAVTVNNCGADDRFMGSRASPDGLPHQPGSFQSTASSLGLYGTHPACSSNYGPQSFCATYNHYALNQEVESAAGFPQCGPLMYSGNISSSMVSQHRQGYSAAPLGQVQYAHAAYGGGHEQAAPFPGCSNPLSPLHAAHLEACCSPLSEGASSAQTFDWMKVKRNPPKTVADRKCWKLRETKETEVTHQSSRGIGTSALIDHSPVVIGSQNEFLHRQMCVSMCR
ncbi:hypothetical protein FQN60_007590 [Etheostoma spectabile]|uniref:Homeobox domain-containing protein n=1 Tax=Etheostoma spectabile TaxID=54343 RepID=A0A5J5D3A6_9PERO|nr:hypothetical protein FQN60_007590 [Etheostoma spectabile]